MPSTCAASAASGLTGAVAAFQLTGDSARLCNVRAQAAPCVYSNRTERASQDASGRRSDPSDIG